MDGDKNKKRRKAMMSDGRSVGWGFVVVRITPTRRHTGSETDVLWADKVICDTDGIKEERTNTFGKMVAIHKLIRSCHDLAGAWLTVRGIALLQAD